MNTKRAPKVRFEGFTDSWELRKFSDLVLIERGGSPRPIDDFITEDPNGLNWVKIGDAPEQGNYITKTAEKIKPEGLSKTRQVQPGDLILSNSMSFGKPYIMAINGCIHDGWLLIRDTQKRFDLKFLCYLLGTPQILEQYKSFAAGSTVNNLNKELVGNTLVTIPTKEEQCALGRYFEHMDHLITLHQRKLDRMKELKKAFLDLIFSQKLRFRGFDQSWRKLKIEDCFSERVERSEKGELISVTVNFGIVKAHSLDRKDNSSENKSNYKIVRKDDIAYNSMRMWQGASGISLYEGILSPAYTVIVPKQGVSSLFFSYEFKLKKMLQTFQVNSQGLTSDTWNLKFPLLRNIVVEAPEYEEQEKVGIFFKKLDNLITLRQEKINQLTKLKTTFLKNMFI